jgi:hypothetical protein
MDRTTDKHQLQQQQQQLSLAKNGRQRYNEWFVSYASLSVPFFYVKGLF